MGRKGPESEKAPAKADANKKVAPNPPNQRVQDLFMVLCHGKCQFLRGTKAIAGTEAQARYHR